MNCATCKSDIDNESFYCDQCGKELFICSTCGKPGKGKNCVEDGGKLFSPKQKSMSSGQNDLSKQNNFSISPQTITPSPTKVFDQPSRVLQTVPPINLSIPVLKLINNREKIDIELKNGEIIGRTQGEHVNVFSRYTQVSGKHLQFVFDNTSGWTAMDLGSTNGSAINNVPDQWQNIPKLTPNNGVAISNNSFLLIANIEFQVKIIIPQTPTGTQRL